MKKRMTLQDKAELALKEAVNEVVARHKREGRSLAVWRDGKVVEIPASQLKVARGK